MSEGVKAAVLRQPGVLRVVEQETPRPGPGEVLVKVKVALTCGTDVKMYRRGHSLAKLPIVIGHEFSGVVEEVGDGVKGLAAGERVVAANSAPCGSCFYCRRMKENLCERLDEVLIGFTYPGAYAEYVIIPERIARRNTYAIPDEVTFEEAAIVEPLACVVNGNEAANIDVGDTVAIIGAGPIGLLHLELAKLRGPERIVVLDIQDSRLDRASQLGADRVVNVEKEDGVARVKALTEGRGADVVIEAVGRVETWDAAVRMSRRGGTTVLFGGCPPGTSINVDTHALHYGELTLKGVFHHTPKTVARALDLVSSKRIEVKPLITSSSPLSGVEDAIERMGRGTDLKVAVKIG